MDFHQSSLQVHLKSFHNFHC